MLYMVIERFKDGNAKAIYERFAERGRMQPEGLRYVGSWVEASLERCFQVMECEDPRLLDEWADHWRDLGDFEFIPVLTSDAARAAALGPNAPRAPSP